MIEPKPESEQSMSELADAAFQATAQDVLKLARDTGTDIVVWKDGRVARIPPDEFECRADDKLDDRQTSG